jgi:uncharacterized protein (TIGR02001 family)
MKKIVLTLAALTLSASLPAQTTPPPVEAAPSSSWTLTNSVATQYMFRGTRLGGLSYQPSLEYDAGGLGLGVWANVPLKDKVVGQSDPEFDFYGFYSMEVAKDISVVPGFTLYTYPDAKKSNGYYKATFEPSLALNYSLGALKLTPKVYYDVILKGPTAELTAAFAVPLKDVGTELDFTATAGTFIWKDYAAETNPDIKNWGDYYLVGVAAPFQVSKDSKITIGWAYTKGSNNYLKQGTDAKVPNIAAVGRGVFTLSYILSF